MTDNLFHFEVDYHIYFFRLYVLFLWMEITPTLTFNQIEAGIILSTRNGRNKYSQLGDLRIENTVIERWVNVGNSWNDARQGGISRVIQRIPLSPDVASLQTHFDHAYF